MPRKLPSDSGSVVSQPPAALLLQRCALHHSHAEGTAFKPRTRDADQALRLLTVPWAESHLTHLMTTGQRLYSPGQRKACVVLCWLRPIWHVRLRAGGCTCFSSGQGPGKVVGQSLQLWHGSGLLLAAREGILMALCRDCMNVHDNATPCPASECKMSCLCCCWLLHTLATSAGWPLLQVFEEHAHGWMFT